MEQAQHLGLSGIGIADRNSVAGVVRAHVVAKDKGLRLAVGARLVFADGTPDILAYPSDRAAWGRLTQLLSKGKLKAEKGDCILHLPDLIGGIEGLNLDRDAAGPHRCGQAFGIADAIEAARLETIALACDQLSLSGRRSAADGEARPHRGRQFRSADRHQ